MSNILIGSAPFNFGFSNGFQTSHLNIGIIEISARDADISSSAKISVESNTLIIIPIQPELYIDAKVSVEYNILTILHNNVEIVNDILVPVETNIINLNILDVELKSSQIINTNIFNVIISLNYVEVYVSTKVNATVSNILIEILEPHIINEEMQLDNPYFDLDSQCKENESKLYDNLYAGVINQVGVDSNWYVTDYSTNNEKTFGEDNDRLIKRKFYIKYLADELPKDERLFDGHGISGMDTFHIYISKQTFEQMSQLNKSRQITYPSYIPKPGDIIQSLHNEVFYEVIEVKDKIELFLQRTHSWDITLRPNINKHYNISLDLITDPINDAIPDEDILGQNDLINNIKSTVLFDYTENFNPFNL